MTASESITLNARLTAIGVPESERGRRLTTMRRIKIALARYDRMQDALAEMESYHSCTHAQYELIARALAPHATDGVEQPPNDQSSATGADRKDTNAK